MTKRQKKEDEEVEEEEENVQPVVDPLENGFLHHAQREQERMTDRLLKRTYSKKNKMVSVSDPVAFSEMKKTLSLDSISKGLYAEWTVGCECLAEK